MTLKEQAFLRGFEKQAQKHERHLHPYGQRVKEQFYRSMNTLGGTVAGGLGGASIGGVLGAGTGALVKALTGHSTVLNGSTIGAGVGGGLGIFGGSLYGSVRGAQKNPVEDAAGREMKSPKDLLINDYIRAMAGVPANLVGNSAFPLIGGFAADAAARAGMDNLVSDYTSK